MQSKIEKSKKLLITGIVLVAIGIAMDNAIKETTGSIGIVLLSVGGLFLILSMIQKRKEKE